MSEPRKKRQNGGLRGRSGNGENYQQKSGGKQHRGPKMNTDMQKPAYQQQTSHDRVRKIVQEEGRSARNLITWNVPLDEQESGAQNQQNQQNLNTPSKLSIAQSPNRKHQRSHSARAPLEGRRRRDSTPPVKTASLGECGASPNSRPSSQNSVGTPSKKGDLRARYWAFLFENLQRAVDEIYQTCETDESVVECKEVIMMLETCTKDFKSLIQRMELLKEFENKDASERPTSLAWEVRKYGSPGKALSQSVSKDHFVPSPTVSRSLNFGQPPPIQRLVPQGNSWADRVKGYVTAQQGIVLLPLGPTQPKDNTAQNKLSTNLTDNSSLNEEDENQVKQVPNQQDEKEEDDLDGWETVQRGSRNKQRPNSAGKPSRQQSRQYQRSLSGKVLYTSPAHSKGDPLSPGGQERTDGSGIRSRRDSKGSQGSRDSEKENRPVKEAWEAGNNVPGSDLQPPSVGDNNGVSSPALSPPDLGTLDSNGNQVSPEEPLHQSPPHSPPHSPEAAPLPGPSHTYKLADEEVFHTDDKEEEDSEQLASELEKELASVIDEEDTITDQLQRAQDEALEHAIQEEESYLKEIEREESTEIMVEADPEADTEADTEAESDLGNTHSTVDLEASMPVPLDWDAMCQQYDADETRSTTSWGELADEVEAGRTPGRVVHMHAKLSSPSRKRSPTESRKRHEMKQAKATEQRQRLLAEKAERLRMLTNKVEEVRAYKDQLLAQRRDIISQKLIRAEEKRHLQLQLKVRRAHEEETKEERQRKHEEKAAKEAAVEERRKALEAERLARLYEMQLKRKQREEEFEQKQQGKEKQRLEAARAKEHEREERIAALNKQQQAHIQELQKKIRQKQDETDRRHKEQLEHIQEKAFHMSILHHSTDDHNEAPNLVPYDRIKFCTVCNMMIPSEVYLLSHLRGKKHQQAISDSCKGKDFSRQEIEDFNLKHISDAPSDKADPLVASEKERQKAFKKRCKKLRQRMTQRGSEYEASLSGKQQFVDSEHKAKLQKVVKDLTKYLQSQGSGPWPQAKVSALDRALGEIGRIMEKKAPQDQTALRLCGGLTTLCRILLVIGQSTADLPTVIPSKSLVHTVSVFKACSKGCYDNCRYLLFSNKVGHIVDLLMHQLNLLIPDNFNVVLSSSLGGTTSFKLPFDPMASSLMQLISTILSCLAKNNPGANSSEASAERMINTSGDAFMSRASDIVSYIVSVGILDKLASYFNNVRGPIDNDPQAGEFLQHSMGLLIALNRIMSKRNHNIFDPRSPEDPTQLIATFQMTELVGIVSLMYGMLLHSGAPARGENPPPELPPHTISVATVGFKMLNHMATLDLKVLQSSLGEEGLSLEFRHIASYLFWYCGHWSNEELLHEVMLCIGYFTILNHDNQVIIQSGQPPTVLQQLCSLPFQYFSNPRLTNILFPTLIACCYHSQRNQEILEQELSCALLANFIEEKTLEAQQGKLSPATVKKSKAMDKEPDTRMTFGARFPVDEWPAVQLYFSSSGPEEH